LATFLTKFGDVQNSKAVTSLSINMTTGGYATIQISGHNHTANPHVAGTATGYADVSGFVPLGDWDGFGVPDFDVTTGDNATPSSATVTFTMEHSDSNDADGNHFVGKNKTPKAELRMDFEGIPTSNTIAALETDFDEWSVTVLVDSTDTSDSNSAFDTFSFTAHANPALATA